MTFISRNASSKSKRTQRKVKSRYRQLIQSVRCIQGVGQEVLREAFLAGYDVPELAHYLPLVARIIDQAIRRVLRGEAVPPYEKLYSLFEEHTELLQREIGRAHV